MRSSPRRRVAGCPLPLKREGFRGARGRDGLAQVPPAFPSCGGEDNSHAPPSPSASLCFVSWVQNKVLRGERWLAKGEIDAFGVAVPDLGGQD